MPRSDERINVVRKMILSHDPAQRKEALDKLLVFQRNDFEGAVLASFSIVCEYLLKRACTTVTGILEAMDGLSVTVRLIDPPLHEFLPKLHGEGI
jgi:pyruvate,orthophosphate dikinase